MAKRISRAEAQLMTWAIIIGLPIYGISQLGESIGWEILIAGVIAIIALYIWYQSAQTKKRRNELMAKYQDSSLVEKLMDRSFWQGQTSGQLLDSLGRPKDIDENIEDFKQHKI